ncbi:MAG: bifunctional 5,10-methylenetetrahydrofolate dehydrogenase/5,10-methenyltetrahydrofolate cyclohydrolase [Candidatus Colwellbacteria bacterium]|nr:bifunctional 5,10-methylenetetrahydrofolate dehydrogenase/5,10-methenyltetrahydrofolate cyclohydrolase [Candidatus Colwellbacteria bacterium]
MQEISGKAIAQDLISKLKAQPIPNRILAAVLVGDDSASVSFLKQKEKISHELGVDFRLYQFPESISNDELRERVGRIALNKKVGGVIVQLPLPEGVNKYYVLNVIPREKDIDVLSERALGAFFRGRNLVAPPSVETVKEILGRQKIDLMDLNVTVVGLGDLVGKPIGVWLLGKCKNVNFLEKNSDSASLAEADLIICGAGQAGIVAGSILKEGAGVIDFGYSRLPNGGLSGDFAVDDNSPQVGFYTPTPGGTGPILIAKLMENFYRLNGSRE